MKATDPIRYFVADAGQWREVGQDEFWVLRGEIGGDGFRTVHPGYPLWLDPAHEAQLRSEEPAWADAVFGPVASAEPG